MSLATQIFGALVATYFLSRLTLWLLQSWDTRSWLRIGAAHTLSWCGIAIVIGYIKAYAGPFSFTAALVYLGPQIAWATLDIIRRTRVL